MTIAGTVPLILCILLWLVQREDFEIRFGMRLLKLSMFFYVMPIQLFYYILPNSIYNFFKFYPRKKVFLNESIQLYPGKNLILNYKQQYIWIPFGIIAIVSIWFLCVIIFATIQVKSYIQLIKNISSHSIHKTKENKNYIVILDNSHSPCSVGFFKTYIVLPKAILDSDYKEVIYKHEYLHIKNHDTWMKLFCLIIICLHFYNPFSYILLFMYNTISEYLCDIYATEGLDIKKRKEYARLLIEISSKRTSLPMVWGNGFSGAKFNMKRRIMYIMKKEELIKSKKIISIILSIITVFISASTIWAYTPLKTTNWNPEEYMEDNKCIEFFLPEDISKSKYYFKDNIDFSDSNTVLRLNDETYIPLPTDESSIKVSCVHSFQTRYLYEHKVNKNGGCSVKKYKIRICSKCNYIKSRILESTISYPKCPHK